MSQTSIDQKTGTCCNFHDLLVHFGMHDIDWTLTPCITAQTKLAGYCVCFVLSHVLVKNARGKIKKI
jgi:hypothetical protein